MALRQSIEVLELLGRPDVDGQGVADVLRRGGVAEVQTERVEGRAGFTDFVRVRVPGAGEGPTLGIIGRLGGVGSRPSRAGLVSDADGAAVVLASALVLSDLVASGDRLAGDVLLATHGCPRAPVIPHDPVPFMGPPVDQATKNRHEVDSRMMGTLSVDTTRGNRLVNRRGFAITPTVKEGSILRVSESLLDLQGWVTGRLPLVLPITNQDLTAYGNDLFHLNSILQPSTATSTPLVGVALTSESVVPAAPQASAARSTSRRRSAFASRWPRPSAGRLPAVRPRRVGHHRRALRSLAGAPDARPRRSGSAAVSAAQSAAAGGRHARMTACLRPRTRRSGPAGPSRAFPRACRSRRRRP